MMITAPVGIDESAFKTPDADEDNREIDEDGLEDEEWSGARNE